MSKSDIVDIANTWAWPIAIVLIVIILREPLWTLVRISGSRIRRLVKWKSQSS